MKIGKVLLIMALGVIVVNIIMGYTSPEPKPAPDHVVYDDIVYKGDGYKVVKMRNCEYVVVTQPHSGAIVGVTHAGDCPNKEHLVKTY